jgi:L-2-hydroxyglutarate oxidase LhgO
MPDDVYDVIIVGGGIMGCATAYYLMKADERLRVAVVEMDPTYSQSSTTLSVANSGALRRGDGPRRQETGHRVPPPG